MKNRRYQTDQGAARHIVEVVSKKGERDETGGYSTRENPVVIYEDHASIDPASSAEISRATARSLTISHTIRMRVIPSMPITADYHLRLKHTPTRMFAIVSLVDVANMGRSYEIQALEEPFKL